MARGRKKALSLDEQLEQVEVEITETEQNLKELKVRRKQLETEIKMKEQEELLTVIQESGKSIDEIRELLAN